MEGILLTDPDLKPEKKVLQKALGTGYQAYEEMLKLVTAPSCSLEPVWRYYNDGKAWLCKVIHRKKTVFWLSVWEGGFFRIVFYFTEKTAGGIYALDISEEIKKNFREHKPVGKFLPLAIHITDKKQLQDLIKIIEYKKKV